MYYLPACKQIVVKIMLHREARETSDIWCDFSLSLKFALDCNGGLLHH